MPGLVVDQEVPALHFGILPLCFGQVRLEDGLLELPLFVPEALGFSRPLNLQKLVRIGLVQLIEVVVGVVRARA